MKIVKVLSVLIAVYIGAIAAMGGFVAYFQPQMPGVLMLTTTDEEGKAYNRLLGRFEVDGVRYLAVNSWPRRWYELALANPNVEITVDGQRTQFTAVRIDSIERQHMLEKYPTPLWMKILSGFPPRQFLRLDPR